MTDHAPLTDEELAAIDPVTLAEKWFLGEYHAEYLAERLNHGDGPDDGSWEPHVGEKAQARADAERIVAAIRTDRLIADLRASRNRTLSDLQAEYGTVGVIHKLLETVPPDQVHTLLHTAEVQWARAKALEAANKSTDHPRTGEPS